VLCVRVALLGFGFVLLEFSVVSMALISITKVIPRSICGLIDEITEILRRLSHKNNLKYRYFSANFRLTSDEKQAKF